MRKPKLLLADEQTLVMEAFRKLLEPQYEVAGIVGDGRTLIAAARTLKPDLIAADIALPVLSGLDAARMLQKSFPASRIVFVTAYRHRTYAASAFRAGAVAYVLKQGSAAELFSAFREALAGRRYLAAALAKEAPGRREPRELTLRELEVLRRVAGGQTNREIAGALRISIKTVGFHKSNITQKLGITSAAELTKYAVVHGLAEF